ncbi:MAG: ATP-binding cassette domain-containing protein [Eubacteriales bacterium]
MIEIQNLSKTFPVSGGTVEALKDISLTIPDGEIYGIIGMSGAGKSTLVRCINMLERPTSGKVIIDGKDLGSLTQAQLREERRNITMIFSEGLNLLMPEKLFKNVCFPLNLQAM